MRYRIRVTRVQVAEKTVSGRDEEHAVAKVQEELERPYGFVGNWITQATELDVVGAESAIATPPSDPGDGPLLLSVKEAAAHLGVSYGSMYELMNRGEIDHVRIGRRRLVAREALVKFIATNTLTGYEGRFA